MMFDNLSLKIDEVGRVLIPLTIRRKYNINKNDILLVSSTDKGIELKLENVKEKYPKVIEKLEFIKEEFNLDMILLEKQKVIYATDKYNFLKNSKCSDNIKKLLTNQKNGQGKNLSITKDFTLNELYYYTNANLDLYNEGILLIVCKNSEEEKLASLVSDLIS